MGNEQSRLPIYHVFGLNIECELSLALLFGMTPASHAVPDAIIRVANVPCELEDPIYNDPFISYVPGCLLLRIEGVARYLITGGKEITIDIEPGAREGDVATFAFGSAIGALLYQRGILALHGSAVRTSKGAIIFSGVKGAGKSTTAAGLASRGWEFMSDDICAIHMENGSSILYPGLSRAKLSLDSYSSVLGKKPDTPAISPIMNKYGVSFNTSREPSLLYAICTLGPTTGSPYIEPISGAERLTLLSDHVYRPLFHQLIESPVQRFRQFIAVSSQTIALRVFRPLDYNKMNEFLQLLEEYILT